MQVLTYGRIFMAETSCWHREGGWEGRGKELLDWLTNGHIKTPTERRLVFFLAMKLQMSSHLKTVVFVCQEQ